MIAATLLLLLLALLLGWGLFSAMAEMQLQDRTLASLQSTIDTLRLRLAQSDADRHSIANSALRGAPAVKWLRPYPVPEGSDPWYWRAMYAGETHLFTDSDLRAARQRAAHLLSTPTCATKS